MPTVVPLSLDVSAGPRAVPRVFVWLVLVLALGAHQAQAQSPACDEGVVRMPDRSGTIQICSAINARLPQLQKQLQDATQAIAAQNGQIAELTRLIRGMNAVSQQVGIDRQTQMLESLARELTRAERQGEDRMARSVALMVDGVDDLQAQMLAVVAKQGGQAALSTALRGPVGDSISRLEFATALRQIDEIERRLQAIEQRLGDVKADTGQILQQMGRVESTLGEMAASFDALRRSAAIISNPSRPEEFYNNAVQYEARGDMPNARLSYRRYFEADSVHFDPAERFVKLVIATEGRAGAIEALRALQRVRPSTVLEAYQQALEPPAQAARGLSGLAQSNPAVGPLKFLLARQYGEDRLGRQTLDDQQLEREALQAFLAAHERGEVIRFFVDQRLAADWLALAETTLKRLAGIEGVKASLNVSVFNAGWQLALQANEPVRRAYYRLASDQPLVDMGQSREIDVETREPMARTFVSLPRGTDLRALEFFYDDLSRVRRGPVKVAPELADPVQATASAQKNILETTATSWVAFRVNMPIVYFTHLASHRCAIRQVRWGWGDALDRTLKLPPCDPDQPGAVPHGDSFMSRFDPQSLPKPQISLEVTYFDGRTSGVRTYEMPANVLASLRQKAAR